MALLTGNLPTVVSIGAPSGLGQPIWAGPASKKVPVGTRSSNLPIQSYNKENEFTHGHCSAEGGEGCRGARLGLGKPSHRKPMPRLA